MDFELEYESGERANDQTTSLSWSSSGSSSRVRVTEADSGCLMSPRKRRVEEEEEMLTGNGVDRASVNVNSSMTKNQFTFSSTFPIL